MLQMIFTADWWTIQSIPNQNDQEYWCMTQIDKNDLTYTKYSSFEFPEVNQAFTYKGFGSDMLTTYV